MDNQQALEHRKRLQSYFRTNPAIWDDIVLEIGFCEHNADLKLTALGCQERDWYAGYIKACRDIIGLKHLCQNWQDDTNAS